MSNDLMMDILNSVLQAQLDKSRADGLTDSEIRDKFSEQKIKNALSEATESIASSTVKTMEGTMYKRVLEERSNVAQFMAHNSQIWEKAFVTSEAMYIIALEAGSDINSYISTLPENQTRDKKFRYCVLGELYGRACQQYLEIIYLVKGGFADGAYARWRSLFELSVISEFIRKNPEEVAKAYHRASFTDDGRFGWAGAAPCFSERKKPEKIPFEEIKKQCSLSTDAWNNQYKLANKVVHATPQGTFDRLSVPSGPRNFTPVGHSDYGLPPPAINAAISLSMIAADYFGFVSSGDSIVYMRVLTKWANLIRKYYVEIEAKCFGEINKDIGLPELQN